MTREAKGGEDQQYAPYLETAFRMAAAALRRKDQPLASMQDAGFCDVRGVGECQVFVKVCRFDPELLKAEPLTGGLLCERQEKTKQA